MTSDCQAAYRLALPNSQRHQADSVSLQITFMGCCVLLTIVALTYIYARSKPVYLIDYHCYKPPDWQAPFITMLESSCKCLFKSWGVCLCQPRRTVLVFAHAVELCRLKMPHQTFLELSKNCGVRFYRPALSMLLPPASCIEAVGRF